MIRRCEVKKITGLALILLGLAYQPFASDKKRLKELLD
jgi:hypothetical protein